jgi:hypothetical protein
LSGESIGAFFNEIKRVAKPIGVKIQAFGQRVCL